ncbi:hypothetical protein [Salinithrix halophila]|uniref:Uncharacterized protein n=1 Tax=Salinithrix halophila TaxID=1485204 RepID=A0ABV8JDX2_9BACL
MDYAKVLSTVSIRGRVAFGITCLEKVCEEWKVKNDVMDHFIQELWTFMKDNSDWDVRVTNLLPDDDDPTLNAKHFGYSYLPLSQQEDLTTLLDEVIHIGIWNDAGAFISELTLEPTLEVGKILTKNNIPVPDISPFLKSPVTDCGGWGKKVDPEFFKKSD